MIKKKLAAICFLCAGMACTRNMSPTAGSRSILPELIKGRFTDDYNIHYTISDSLWILEPRTRYHILRYHVKDQYIIARNDTANEYAPGLYTRIDIMPFTNMQPYTWGFCLTAYEAKTPEAAATTPTADRANPRKGCGGYPFSRMKRQ